MGEMTSEGGRLNDAAFDLTQFYQVFFEEAGENLTSMEDLLLAVDVDAPDDEALNAIFRCAHSIKGGAATFGFQDVADLTHVMETLLDRLRRHELTMTTVMVDTLLESGDALKALLDVRQGKTTETVDTRELVATIRELSTGATLAPKPAEANASNDHVKSATVAQSAATAAAGRTLEIRVESLADPSVVDSFFDLFREVGGLGTIDTAPAAEGQAESTRRFKVVTSAADNDLLDLFTFHVAREQVTIGPWNENAGPTAPTAPAEEAAYGFFVDPATLPIQVSKGAAAAKPEKPSRADKVAVTSPETTIRVSVDKVDQLINLMGELVITQAMLAQCASEVDPAVHQGLLSGLTDLERNTRHLQESVMSIRMIPMAVVFNRFPRMLRDLASKLSKQVELETVGEATELDKSLIEKITDPLTHLVRNSLDHGIETPEERRAAGKPAQGTITLSAQHSGGSIVIEVRDDGRGLDRDRILAKARSSGLSVSDSMSDQEVWQLIFAPGFSTAEVVTEVSGRGVGMDVVKRNILALNGTVELDSAPGYGTRVSVRLPLTLAIMDGMSIKVGDELYVLPLCSVIESFLLTDTSIRTVLGSSRVVQVRDAYMPVVVLEDVFGVKPGHAGGQSQILVIVEAEGRRIALEIDELVGQQQVVVKNLESNYRKVPNVSGATIMGDGRVALILDVAGLIRQSSH
ncbi:MAG: chemotaxis protein CheW [Burkholderiales bacterium]|nr:chemotaxis protein CheW [Burkholderiales bacterium]